MVREKEISRREFLIYAVLIFLIPLIKIPYFVDIYALPKATLLWMMTPLFILTGNLRVRKELFPVYLWVILYFLMSVLSIYPLLSFLGLYKYYFHGFLALLGGFCLMLMVSSVSEGKQTLLAKVMLFSVLAACGYGLLKPFAERLSSTFGNPNFFGGVIAMVLPFALYFASENKKYFIAVGVFFVCLILTFSRASWIGAASGVVFLLASLRFRKILITVAAVVSSSALALFVFFPASFFNAFSRFTSIFNIGEADILSRFKGYEASLRIFAQHPLMGSGPESFSVLFRAAAPASFVAQVGDLAHAGYTHSYPLQLLTDTGIVGFGAYLFLILIILKVSFSSESGLKKAAGGAVAAHFAGNIFAFPTITEVMIFWISAGIVFAESFIHRQGKLRKASILHYAAALSAALLLMMPMASEIFFSKAMRSNNPEDAFKYFNFSSKFLPADHHLMAAGRMCVFYYNSSLSDIWLERANVFFASLIKRNPRNALALNGAGFAMREYYYKTREKKYLISARSFFEKAASADPFLKAAYINLALLYEKEGTFPDAVKIYEKALEIYPTDEAMLFNCGVINANIGKYSEALTLWKKLERINPEYKKLKKYIKETEKLLKINRPKIKNFAAPAPK